MAVGAGEEGREERWWRGEDVWVVRDWKKERKVKDRVLLEAGYGDDDGDGGGE